MSVKNGFIGLAVISIICIILYFIVTVPVFYGIFMIVTSIIIFFIFCNIVGLLITMGRN